MDKTINTKILLADDNKANLRISKAMLEAVGASVEVAENGFEVLALIPQHSFDLIFMDCQMPEMDGFEATKKIRAMDDGEVSLIPIIALTADVQADTKEECLQCGMNDFLSKPFTLDDLRVAIEKWTNPPKT